MKHSLLKENASLIEQGMRFVEPLLLVLIGWALYVYKFTALDIPPHYLLALVAAYLFVLILFPFFNIYRAYRGVSLWAETQRLLSAWGAVVTLLILLMFATKSSANFSREWIGLWALLGFVGLAVFRSLVRMLLRSLRRRGFNLRHIYIVGAGDLGREVASRLAASPWMGLHVAAFYDDNPALQKTVVAGVPVQGTLDDLPLNLQDADIDQVWMTLPLRAEDRAKSLLHNLRHHNIQIRFVPDIYGFQLLNHSITEVAGLPVINLTESPMSGVNHVLKLFEDQVLAVVFLILLAPLMFAVAIGVKLSSPGPVFYRQRRVTWNGEHFEIYKFRSMAVGAERESGPVWAKRNDARTHPFGALLRRWSLDELPQLFNVLKGQMSIVGPRPERPEFIEKFKDLVPGYMQKHLVKAGITGWAQVNDLRGDSDLHKRIEYDLFYIENWSVWFDLRIIFLTVFKIFTSRHAF